MSAALFNRSEKDRRDLCRDRHLHPGIYIHYPAQLRRYYRRQIHEYVEHLERRTRELQESNASLEEFAYAASHDLKEPLRKISIFIKLLGESLSNATDKDKLFYDRILAAADRMTALIDDLLSLSVLSREAQPERYSLEKVLSDTLQILDRKIEETGAKIESTVLPEAKIIPSQFALLFQNLLSNSLKFTRPGCFTNDQRVASTCCCQTKHHKCTVSSERPLSRSLLKTRHWFQ
ncbi:MAG: histidine kinase dimerization/phospho-acceptor domain-containing protein [Bacteroidota bacterium]